MDQSQRKKLHQRLTEIIAGRGKLYFQPPADVRLSYDCVIYEMTDIETRHADNANYKLDTRYTITVITRNPDSKIGVDILKGIPKSSFDRRFVTENLYHDIITVYW